MQENSRQVKCEIYWISKFRFNIQENFLHIKPESKRLFLLLKEFGKRKLFYHPRW